MKKTIRENFVLVTYGVNLLLFTVGLLFVFFSIKEDNYFIVNENEIERKETMASLKVTQQANSPHEGESIKANAGSRMPAAILRPNDHENPDNAYFENGFIQTNSKDLINRPLPSQYLKNLFQHQKEIFNYGQKTPPKIQISQGKEKLLGERAQAIENGDEETSQLSLFESIVHIQQTEMKKKQDDLIQKQMIHSKFLRFQRIKDSIGKSINDSERINQDSDQIQIQVQSRRDLK